MLLLVVVLQAAIVAARRNKTAVDLLDFESAVDRVIAGLESHKLIRSVRARLCVIVWDRKARASYQLCESLICLSRPSLPNAPLTHTGYRVFLPVRLQP
jgi:cell division protease FtsH